MTEPRLDRNDPEALRQFIRANTQLLAPPLTPEIRLHLAAESMPIWGKTEEDLGEMNIPPPYWAFAWAGGQALARYLLDHPEICRGQTVIDLGAGSGLTAIAAAKTGAGSVVAVDIDVIALAACGLNATANGVAFGVTADDQLSRSAEANIILIGDLFYERELADRVLLFIAAAKSAGAIVFIGDPQRSYFPRGAFSRLTEYAVPVTRDLEDAEIKKTAVWRA